MKSGGFVYPFCPPIPPIPGSRFLLKKNSRIRPKIITTCDGLWLARIGNCRAPHVSHTPHPLIHSLTRPAPTPRYIPTVLPTIEAIQAIQAIRVCASGKKSCHFLKVVDLRRRLLQLTAYLIVAILADLYKVCTVTTTEEVTSVTVEQNGSVCLGHTYLPCHRRWGRGRSGGHDAQRRKSIRRWQVSFFYVGEVMSNARTQAILYIIYRERLIVKVT